MESLHDNRQILNAYVEQGWKLVPIDKEKRHPNRNGWERTDFSVDQILRGMERGHGVGVQTGPPSGGLVVVDLDSHYARVCGYEFLPRTLEIGKEGERGGLSSLWLYYSEAAPKVGIKPLNPKAEKGFVVELLGAPKSQGRQFIVPPSMHPKKGAYQWVGGFDPKRIVTIEAEDLERRVRHLAAAALIAEHLPDSGRHDLSLALGGYMGRHDETLETVESIVAPAWEAHGGEVDAAVQNVRDTFDKLHAGEKVTGGKELNKIVPGLAGKLADALGWEEQDRPLTAEEKKARADRAWGACAELAKSDDILSEVYALQQQDGLVGEETNAKIMQLVSVTRHKGQPMSAIINGESSGGKSFLLKETAKTLPDEAVYALQSISDKALAYIGENTLSNKFLLVYELGGLGKEGESGIEMVKQLLTEGRIDRQIAEGTAKGVQGKRVYAEGPTGLWTTTTKNVIDSELQNRALALTIDESPAQTERIIKGRRTRKRRGGVDFTPVKSLHTWLAGQGGDVDVPYEDVVADGVNARAVRMRRFYDYIMELVEAHALLHRATRVVDAAGTVLAKPEDYAAVYELVKLLVSEAAEVSVSETQRETVEAAKRVVESEKPLTSNTLAEELGISRSSASRRLGHAASEGYVKHDPDAKGNTKVYVMGEIQLPDKATPAIPDPEGIWDAMQAAYDEVCKCATCASATTQDVDDVKSVVNCASPLCTLRAQLGSEESVLTEKPHRNGHYGEGSSHKSEVSYPPVHTLHTCTVEENPSENGSVHASVQDPVHSSEDSDADPLAEWKARREGRILDALADMYVSHEDRYHELPEAEKELIRAWVSDNAALRNVTRPRDSYELKHTVERFLGFYVSNGSIKGALLEAGYEPAWSGPINMGFRVGPRPGSDWAEKPYGPRVIAPRLLYTWAPIPEYPASRARRQHND
jgi:hypothetical protein